MNEKPEALLRRQHADNISVAHMKIRIERLEAENERLREALMRLQYDFKGHIKRHPSEEEVDAALRREDV